MSETHTSIAAVRGAIQVAENRAELIQAATARLLSALVERNALSPSRIVSALFTATPDLDADFPAHAARRLGWTDVPLLGAVEMAVPGAPPRVVRVLLTVSDVPTGARLVPVYLDGAAALRPDLVPDRGTAPAPAAKPRTIAIIGLGQIGGSIGLALAGRSEWRRAGFDRDPAAGAAALAGGAVDSLAASVAEACAGADLAVIATPVDAIPECIRAATEALPGGAALVDTGSARRGVTAALREARGRGIDAIGGHPLAGNEGRGFASARAGLFRGTRFVLCPVEGAGSAVPVVVGELVSALGGDPRVVDSEEHDAALARTSHLPYLLARALESIGSGAHARGLSGPAFRDMTRVAGADPSVAEAYCHANLERIEFAWRALRADVELRLSALGRVDGTGGS